MGVNLIGERKERYKDRAVYSAALLKGGKIMENYPDYHSLISDTNRLMFKIKRNAVSFPVSTSSFSYDSVQRFSEALFIKTKLEELGMEEHIRDLTDVEFKKIFSLLINMVMASMKPITYEVQDSTIDTQLEDTKKLIKMILIGKNGKNKDYAFLLKKNEV